MRDHFLTPVILSQSSVPFRKDSDGNLYAVLSHVLQKGTRLLLDSPMEYKNPHTNTSMRLIRFRTDEGPHDELKNLFSGLFLIESFTSYSRADGVT
jgi:hypothetical protein